MTRILIEREAAQFAKMTVSELYHWAKNITLRRSRFCAVQKALLNVGIDYDKKRQLERTPYRRAVNLRDPVPVIEWCVGVDLDTGRFAICTEDGSALWIAPFDKETTTARFYETACRKTIWLAAMLANKIEHTEAFTLQLKVDRYWTSHAKAQHDWNKPITKLTKYARDSGIGLDVRSINSKNNPANILLTEIPFGEHKDFDHHDFLETLQQHKENHKS